MNNTPDTDPNTNPDLKKKQDHDDYILKDNTKTKFGASFIIIVVLILLVGVAISAMYFEWW